MRRALPFVAIVAATFSVAISTAAGGGSPQARSVAQAQRQWLSELLGSARNGDRSTVFPSPSRAILMERLAKAETRYGVRVVSVRMLHPLQSAPVIVISSNNEQAVARATPKIIDLFDPRHPTNANPSGYAYEGYSLTAEDSHGIPYLATFNHWRAPHVGGGQWAAKESLYPFAHL